MKLNYLLYATVALTITGCNDDFLERAPQDLNDQTFWATANDLKTYANAFYGILPGGVTNLGDTDSDNQVPQDINTFIWGNYVVPTEDGLWSKSNWSNLRQINYFMARYQQAEGTEEEINNWVAEMRFFRALEYFNKIKTFGDVPWLERDLDIDSEELFGPKMARNEVARKIIEDLDFAIQWLPEKGSEEDNRLNKDIARHVKARVCLNEGTQYKYHTELGYTGEANEWLQMAADEAETLINSGRYAIYSTGKPTDDYSRMFILEDKSNLSEAILYIDYADPLRLHSMSQSANEPYCGFSKDFADSFLCDDGLPISISDRYLGDDSLDIESANRDPRFKQLIHTKDLPRTITNDLQDTTFYETDAAFTDQMVRTGYKCVKGLDPVEANLRPGRNYFDGIAYRYAETLLIFAEAKAELGTLTQADLDKSINRIRDRVAMPHLTTNVGFTDPKWPNYGYSLSPVLQEIRRERRIELAGEGFRFDDIKRWKAGELLNNVFTYLGKKQSDGSYAIPYPNYTNADYSYQPGKSRTWDDKLYLYPIPTGELQRNPNLLPQNPGWEE